MENKVVHTPDSWQEVNIETLQELMATDNIYERIGILIDEDSEEIRKYDTDTFVKISKALGWIHELPKEESMSNVIKIQGEEYGFDKLSNLLLGQWIDVEEYVKEPIHNIHKLMALFYRPLLVKLNDGTNIVEDYDVVSANVRAELFRKEMKVSECYGALVFFSHIEKNCLRTIQGYFQVEIIKMKLIQEKQKQKEKKGLQKKKGLLSGLGSLLRIK